MLTINYTDLMLTLITAFLAAGVLYFIFFLHRLSNHAEEWNKTLSKLAELIPHLQRLVGQAEESLASAKGMTARGETLLEDIQIVTSRTREVALLGLSYVETILRPLRSIALVFQGFQAGLAVFQRLYRPSKPELEVDQEETHE